jgi:hypothetical protein
MLRSARRARGIAQTGGRLVPKSETAINQAIREGVTEARIPTSVELPPLPPGTPGRPPVGINPRLNRGLPMTAPTRPAQPIVITPEEQLAELLRNRAIEAQKAALRPRAELRGMQSAVRPPKATNIRPRR